jgi:methyl-accepting chemotaxis protein
MGGTLILIILIVSIYGTKLTGTIKSLTDVADRISVGELDAEIKIKSKDELGDLAEAISRMQDSIRLSIERLRRRR